jgi:hypothetical protein
MRIIAPMMILIMMTSTLAGCTGGDPDGGGNDNIDMDVLNQLIDDNLQDFVNNTTITVENHYHNNTTIVNNHYDNDNHFNNTTNVDGGEIYNYDNSTSIFNGSSSSINSGEYYLLDIEFNIEDVIPGWNDIDYRNNTFNYSWEYYDYSTNEERTDMFEFSCQVFYIVGANSANGSAQVSWWEDSSQYYNAWANTYNSTVRDLLQDAGGWYSRDSVNNMLIEEICNEDYYATYSGLLYEIPIVEGMAIRSIDRNYDWNQYQIEYVWVQNCVSSLELFNGDYQWEQSYSPLCESGNTVSVSAFSVNYVFETIPFYYSSMGWVGGSSDSLLEVHVNEIRPGFEYRLIVYFEMTTNMNNL